MRSFRSAAPVAAATACLTSWRSNANSPSSERPVPPSQQLAPGPYRRVGNVIFVTAIDHPFKFGWEANKMLRDLRIEFKGQNVVHPDIPEVRLRLWRVRHAVKCELVDLDEAKALIGVPAHVTFSDIAKTIPDNFGRRGGSASPLLRAKVNFTAYRRMRMKDIMLRDAVELRLLAEKKKLRAARESAQAKGPQ